MPKNGYAENLDLAYISRLESITMTRAEIMLRLEHCNRATVQYIRVGSATQRYLPSSNVTA